MDGNIDTVREALDYARRFSDNIGIEYRCNAALAALSAIDHEAIRAEARAEGIRLAADRVRRYFDGLPYYEGSYTNGLHAAIISAEPAQDDGRPEIGLQVEAWVWPSGEWKIRGASKDAWKEHGAFQIVQITLGAEVKRRLEEYEE